MLFNVPIRFTSKECLTLQSRIQRQPTLSKHPTFNFISNHYTYKQYTSSHKKNIIRTRIFLRDYNMKLVRDIVTDLTNVFKIENVFREKKKVTVSQHTYGGTGRGGVARTH
jgi:hypothetical protein